MKKDKKITFSKLSYRFFNPLKTTEKEATRKLIKKCNSEGLCVMLPIRIENYGLGKVAMASTGYGGKKFIKKYPTINAPKERYFTVKEFARV